MTTIVIGAGLAGATAAFVLDRAGIKVTLVDPTTVQPVVFKAEKIEEEQADLLREFRLMDSVLPECRNIRRIACAQNGRLWRYLDTEQYGCFYHDMVNAVRRALPASVRVLRARAVALNLSNDLQQVRLDDGSNVEGRLLVLASGTAGKLVEGLGFEREMRSAGHSLCLGFNFAPVPRLPGGADSVTYSENSFQSKIDYLTLFPIKEVLRANMFTYWNPKDSVVREMRQDAAVTLSKLTPRLKHVTGPLTVTSTIEAVPIHLYRVHVANQPGIVLLGDAYQSVCPSTGTGLSKVLVDVDTLSKLAPDWFKTPGMGAEKVAAYYATVRKQKTDDYSLNGALHRKTLCLSNAPVWVARRWRKHFRRWVASLRISMSRGGAPSGPGRGVTAMGEVS